MKYFLSFSFLTIPLVAQAAGFQNLDDVLRWVLNLVNSYFIPLLVALGLLAFFWRNIVALAKKDELVSKAETKWYLLWGVIAIFVMVSVWGLVGILADIFGIKNVVPQLNTGDNNGTGSGDPLPACDLNALGANCDTTQPIFFPVPGGQ